MIEAIFNIIKVLLERMEEIIIFCFHELIEGVIDGDIIFMLVNMI